MDDEEEKKPERGITSEEKELCLSAHNRIADQFAELARNVRNDYRVRVVTSAEAICLYQFVDQGLADALEEEEAEKQLRLIREKRKKIETATIRLRKIKDSCMAHLQSQRDSPSNFIFFSVFADIEDGYGHPLSPARSSHFHFLRAQARNLWRQTESQSTLVRDLSLGSLQRPPPLHESNKNILQTLQKLRGLADKLESAREMYMDSMRQVGPVDDLPETPETLATNPVLLIHVVYWRSFAVLCEQQDDLLNALLSAADAGYGTVKDQVTEALAVAEAQTDVLASLAREGNPLFAENQRLKKALRIESRGPRGKLRKLVQPRDGGECVRCRTKYSPGVRFVVAHLFPNKWHLNTSLVPPPLQAEAERLVELYPDSMTPNHVIFLCPNCDEGFELFKLTTKPERWTVGSDGKVIVFEKGKKPRVAGTIKMRDTPDWPPAEMFDFHKRAMEYLNTVGSGHSSSASRARALRLIPADEPEFGGEVRAAATGHRRRVGRRQPPGRQSFVPEEQKTGRRAETKASTPSDERTMVTRSRRIGTRSPRGMDDWTDFREALQDEDE